MDQQTIDDMSIGELQKECAKALATMDATSVNIHQFNKQAHHNSHNWYKAVLSWYIEQYGNLPRKAGPGVDINLIME